MVAVQPRVYQRPGNTLDSPSKRLKTKTHTKIYIETKEHLNTLTSAGNVSGSCVQMNSMLRNSWVFKKFSQWVSENGYMPHETITTFIWRTCNSIFVFSLKHIYFSTFLWLKARRKSVKGKTIVAINPQTMFYIPCGPNIGSSFSKRNKHQNASDNKTNMTSLNKICQSLKPV